MTTHTTNYQSTFILPSPDSKASTSQIPKKPDSVAGQQYAIISAAPYQLTSDDVVFEVFSRRNDVAEVDRTSARDAFFSKGQPYLRASPLVKSHGFGVHADGESRIALVGVETDEFVRLVADEEVVKRSGMRSSST